MRNLGILLLFPFHAARVFDYWDPFYVKNTGASWVLSLFIAVTAYWFMPLLFYLAGASSWYALKKRTGAQYLKERFHRLFIPLIFGLIIIVPPQGYIAKLTEKEFNSNYLEFLKSYFMDFSDLTGYFGSFTPAHLWFILYLFVFSLVSLPLFKLIEKLQSSSLKIIDYLNSPLVLVMLFIPLTLTEALPGPGGQNPFYYILIFILGYIMSLSEGMQKAIGKLKFKALIFLIVYIPIWFSVMINNSNTGTWSLTAIGIAFMKNLAVWLTLIVILGYGRKHLSKKSKIISYMNEAAFPVYILHQTILVIVSFYMVRLSIAIYLKFIIIVVLSFIITILLYEVLKRIEMARWLLGMKSNSDYRK
ncbi:acyltransferase family protein [Wukongibacter baidiensis]|uniref:acyltransferase family protein n=1 Tax=Wukongibacter baidiensis TaxID=1723361 RepID=UPI003D7FF644